MMLYFIVYLALINLLSLILMFVDKQKAKRRKWRIRESTLIFSALIGGSIGMLLGMYLFRHKTRHPKFFIGVPVILILQVLLVIGLFFYGVLPA